MDKKTSKSNIKQLIDRLRWAEILPRFSDVLKVNVFVIDSSGSIVFPPAFNKYGGRFLLDASFKFDAKPGTADFISRFEHYGPYLESINRFDLHLYAIPMYGPEQNGKEEPVGYMIVGPVVIHKKLDPSKYVEMARGLHLKQEDEFLSALGDIKVFSNIAVNSILDLLSEIVKSHVEVGLATEKIVLEQLMDLKEERGRSSADELLPFLLEMALKMTNAECGSIMLFDEDKEHLVIKISKGLDEEKVKEVRIRLGEGLAGLAAKENRVFHIEGQSGANRMKPYLNRPEIKESFIMPLIRQNHVFGVMNLSTKREKNKLTDNIENLQHLSRVLPIA